jgi:hypothetical protein
LALVAFFVLIVGAVFDMVLHVVFLVPFVECVLIVSFLFAGASVLLLDFLWRSPVATTSTEGLNGLIESLGAIQNGRLLTLALCLRGRDSLPGIIFASF